MKHSILVLSLLAAGCAAPNIPADPTKMSADQLREWVKDKNASVACASGKTAAGNITLITANLDKAAVTSGSMTVDADCKVTITADKKAP